MDRHILFPVIMPWGLQILAHCYLPSFTDLVNGAGTERRSHTPGVKLKNTQKSVSGQLGMESRNKDQRSGKGISRGGITKALAGRSIRQAEHRRRNHVTRGKKRETLRSCAQTVQTNTTDREHRLLECHRPGYTQRGVPHSVETNGMTVRDICFCTSTDRVFEYELTTP